MTTVEIWDRTDVVLRSEVTYSDPTEDVTVTGTFTGPDGQVLRLRGFWDGGDEWRVRFAPTAVGEWHYVVTATDASNAGLHGHDGVVSAVPTTRIDDLHRSGFVRVSDDRRGFVYADGTPFFWLGDTHWQAFNYERLTESNHPGHDCESQFRCTVAADIDRGFTVYQTYPDAGMNDGGGNTSQVDWWDSRYDRLDPAAFRDQFDVMMDHIADSGLTIALGLGVHHVNGKIGAEAMTRFARYAVARYASYPVVWLTGQEVDVQADGVDTLSVWREVARTIADVDGYHHPLGAHMDSVGDPKTFGEEPWHDWFPVQGGHDVIRTREHYRTYWDYAPARPFIETEAFYEGLFGTIDAGLTRRSAWRAVQCGSRGYTYGAAGVWAIKWDRDVPGWDLWQGDTTWYEGLALPGGAQMAVLRRFYESLPHAERMIPAFDESAHAAFVDPENALLSRDGEGTTVVYFSDDATHTGSLLGLSGIVSAVWFDPRTGATSPITDTAVDGGTWPIPERPSAEDWALHVTS